MNRLAERDDIGVTHQRNCVKAMKMLFKWRHHEHGLDEWDPPFTFSREPATQPRDYLTREERRTIRAAALDYGAVPSYNHATPTERDRVTAYLAPALREAQSRGHPGRLGARQRVEDPLAGLDQTRYRPATDRGRMVGGLVG
jgi:hypothetical protein